MALHFNPSLTTVQLLQIAVAWEATLSYPTSVMNSPSLNLLRYKTAISELWKIILGMTGLTGYTGSVTVRYAFKKKTF